MSAEPELSLRCSECGTVLMEDVTKEAQEDPHLAGLLCVKCLIASAQPRKHDD